MCDAPGVSLKLLAISSLVSFAAPSACKNFGYSDLQLVFRIVFAKRQKSAGGKTRPGIFKRVNLDAVRRVVSLLPLNQFLDVRMPGKSDSPAEFIYP